ncbi:MAG TPA: Mrp/NBP35 family ATP-binding protein [Candidatus Binatia bacterium]|nr:Mrp/NBP35 family ATP-binding protein [Candidatus Binatia bacterium]
MATARDVLDALRSVKYPGFSRDIVSFGIVRDIEVGGLGTVITLAPPADSPDLADRLRAEIVRAASSVPGVGDVTLVTAPAPTPAAPARPRGPQGIPGVANVLAVASGKGGVGKSTVAANLAVALLEHGSVGLLDADVYGPSVPLLLGLDDAEPHVTSERRIHPLEAHGLRAISMGSFVERDRPVIWRGPMVTKLIGEFLHNVDWGQLDYLVLDLPPGTGDVQLTLSQQLAMTGGVIVTTPQDVALADVKRGLKMFQQVNVPVLGVIENMSGHVCAGCGHRSDIFGSGGGKAMAAQLGIPFLGAIALTRALRESADAGTPLVAADPANPVSAQFREIAATIVRAAADREALRVTP